jgi:hypothetical protein
MAIVFTNNTNGPGWVVTQSGTITTQAGSDIRITLNDGTVAWYPCVDSSSGNVVGYKDHQDCMWDWDEELKVIYIEGWWFQAPVVSGSMDHEFRPGKNWLVLSC